MLCQNILNGTINRAEAGARCGLVKVMWSTVLEMKMVIMMSIGGLLELLQTILSPGDFIYRDMGTL